jgi:hypothetical protein
MSEDTSGNGNGRTGWDNLGRIAVVLIGLAVVLCCIAMIVAGAILVYDRVAAAPPNIHSYNYSQGVTEAASVTGFEREWNSSPNPHNNLSPNALSEWAAANGLVGIDLVRDPTGLSVVVGPGLSASQISGLQSLTGAMAVNCVTNADGQEVGNAGFAAGYLRCHFYNWPWSPAYNAVQSGQSQSPQAQPAVGSGGAQPPAGNSQAPAGGYAPGQGNPVAQPYEVTDTTQMGCEHAFPIKVVEEAAKAAGVRAEIQKHDGDVCLVVLEGIKEEADAHAALGVLGNIGALEIAVVDLGVPPDGLIEPNPAAMNLCPWGNDHVLLNIYLQGTLHPDPAQVGIICQN